MVHLIRIKISWTLSVFDWFMKCLMFGSQHKYAWTCINHLVNRHFNQNSGEKFSIYIDLWWHFYLLSEMRNRFIHYENICDRTFFFCMRFDEGDRPDFDWMNRAILLSSTINRVNHCMDKIWINENVHTSSVLYMFPICFPSSIQNKNSTQKRNSHHNTMRTNATNCWLPCACVRSVVCDLFVGIL